MVRVSLQAALTVSSVVCSGVRWPPNSSARASRCRVRQRTPSSSGWPSDRCMRPAESSSRLRWALHVPERACSSSKSSGVPESMRTTGRAQRDACSGPPQREEPVASGTDSIFPFAVRRGTERKMPTRRGECHLRASRERHASMFAGSFSVVPVVLLLFGSNLVQVEKPAVCAKVV